MVKRNESQSATKGADPVPSLQTNANVAKPIDDLTREELIGLLQYSNKAAMEHAEIRDSLYQEIDRLKREAEAVKAAVSDNIAAIEVLVEENNALRAQAETGVFVPGEVVVAPTPPKPTLRDCVVALENRIEEAMSTAGENKGRQVRPGPLTAMLAALQEFRRNHPNTPQPDPFLDLA